MGELGTIPTKVCSECKEDKDHTNFTKDKQIKDGFDKYCKVCKKLRSLARYTIRKAACFEYKGSKCEICGVIENPYFYDFHHRVPEDKLFCITTQLKGKWDDIKAELDKCLMLCPNCHRKEHMRMKDDKSEDKTTE